MNTTAVMEAETSGNQLKAQYDQLRRAYAELLSAHDALRKKSVLQSLQTGNEDLAGEPLRENNERVLSAPKASYEAIWHWDLVNDHLYWGEGYEKIFGYRVSRSKNHIHSFDNIHPEDKQSVFAGIDKLVAGTESNWTGEYRYRKFDGEYVYVQDTAVIIRDADGKAVRMIGAMQDISQRKLSEEAARRSQEKFNLLVNTIDGIVWEADASDFHFTYVSDHAEKLLGYSKEEWVNDPRFWSNHIHPDDREWVVRFCESYTRLQKQHQFEYRMIAKDGCIVWLADFVSVVVTPGEPVQLRGVMVDITARKNAEYELQLKNAQLKELSAHLQNVREEERRYLAREVHDELGQLAAVVKMDIDWIRIKMEGLPSNFEKRLDHASSTTHLLINTIRKLASELRPGMLDELGLNASLEWQCKKFTEIHHIPCRYESSFDDTALDTQIKTALYRICQEALSNVKRHAFASHVTVTLEEKEDHICLVVRDNGRGFETTEQVHALGLIGIRERCMAVNGTLSVDSGQGEGTTVCATIPKQKT